MTLAFSQKINDKPTYFIDKIWYSFLFRNDDLFDKNQEYHKKYIEKFGDNWDFREVHHNEEYEKLHTIRKDTSNRWKAGSDIHFVINNRTPERFQFAPVVKCVSTQKIRIKRLTAKEVNIFSPKDIIWSFRNHFIVSVDDQLLSRENIKALAINDGFNSVHDFFEYFNTDFTGKIIHWTNLKY
jgi:hypothetical protein